MLTPRAIHPLILPPTLPYLFYSFPSPNVATHLSRTLNPTTILQFLPPLQPQIIIQNSSPSSAQLLPPCHPPLVPGPGLGQRESWGPTGPGSLREGKEIKEMVQPEKRKGKRSQAARWAGEEGK